LEGDLASVTAGTKTVSSAGTRVQVSSTPTPVRRVRFQAPPGNSGITYVGTSTVSSSVAGIEFAAAGGSETVDFTEGRPGDLSEFYCDAATNGDKIHYMAVLV
jgi:hypothetical protein